MADLARVRAALLERLAAVESWRRERVAELQAQQASGVVNIHSGRVPNPEHFPTWFPLFADPWLFDDRDVLIAAKESAALGEIELSDRGIVMVRVTDRAIAVADKMGRALTSKEAT